jgi:hypothetical protein
MKGEAFAGSSQDLAGFNGHSALGLMVGCQLRADGPMGVAIDYPG